MGQDESNKNKMNANAEGFTPASYNGQNTYSRVPAPAANEGGSQSGDQQSQQSFDQQQLYSQWGGFPASPNWQNSYSYSQAPAANGGTLPYGATYSVGNAWLLYDPSANQQSQQTYHFTDKQLEIEVENGKLSFSKEAKDVINGIVGQYYIPETLRAQELFYFANCIFCKRQQPLRKKRIHDFGTFFDKYTEQIEEITQPQYIQALDNFKDNATNYGNKVTAEIIYTVLNGLTIGLLPEYIIDQIWKGHFLFKYYEKADKITHSRLGLNLIESALTKNLAMYETQDLQSALYEYLTPANSGITRDELDIRKELLTEVNTGEKLEYFKKNTLVPKLLEQRPELEKEGKIDTSALEGIFIIAANNGLTFPLKENDGLDSVIFNYIRRVDPKNENNVKTLSNIINAVLYPSVAYMLSEQDNAIIEALKAKLNKIKQKICEKGKDSESYLFYSVSTINKFMNYYESKKSKKQSSESAKPAEQEEKSDSNFLENLENIKNYADTNKKKAITTLINSKQQPKNESQDKLETFVELQNKDKESESKTESQFEGYIKNIIEETFKATENNSFTIDAQHEIKGRKVDFYIYFEKNCDITICDNFIIPIKAGTEIVIEADGTPHFENGILPKNLEEVQGAITEKTRRRNREIEEDFIDNKDLCDSLKKRVSTFRDKEDQLLKLAYYLQNFEQRRKHLDPTIYSDLFKEFYGSEEEIENHATSGAINSSGNIPQLQKSPQDTRKDEKNSVLLEMTQELEDLQNTLQLKDVKEVIQDSIKKSKLFFSIPLLASCIKDRKYQEEEIKKVFLNCFINAYCSQALSNLKKFYRRKAEEEKKELENRRKAEEEQKEPENTKTNQEGQNGRLDSLHVVGNCQTNIETGGSNALEKIKEAKDQEKEEIKKHLNSMPTIHQETQTSGQGNVLQ